MNYQRYFVSGLLATLLVSGCTTAPSKSQDQYTVPANKPRAVTPATGAALSSAPYLRTVVPVNALAYARIPSLWAVLGNPKGNLYSEAVGSAPYQVAVTTLRDGFRKNIAPEFKEGSEVLWRLFMTHGASPAEFLLLPGATATAPAVNLLFSLQIDLDRAALNGTFSEMAAAISALRITKSIDINGDGLLSIGELTLPVHFDQRNQRLFVMQSGQSADLNALLAALTPAPTHPMYPLERSMDTTGQGFFFWASGAGMKQGLALLGDNPQASSVVSALEQSRGVALGWGTRDQRQRIRLVLDMPQIGFRRYTPLGAQTITLNAAGTPQMVFMMSLPDQHDWAMLEQGLAESLAPKDLQDYQENKHKIEARIGASVEEVLSAVGKEWLYVSDDAGGYLAIPIRDNQRLNALLEKIEQQFKLKIEHRDVNGRQYSHLVVPSLMNDGEPDHKSLWTRWGQLPSHFYWTQEDGYLLMASTPQPIIDRYYQPLRTPLHAWLKNQQQQDPAGALLFATLRSEGVPRLLYNFNLSVLQSLGDYVSQPLDLFTLPTPRELNLPTSGAFTFRVDSTAEQLAMELSFDSNPLEVLLTGNGMMGLATIGVVSAIAIPAYQDYTLRAQVAEAFISTTTLTQTLSDFHAKNDRFPNASETKRLDAGKSSPLVSKVFIEPQSGQITIDLALPQLADKNQLTLTPKVENRQVEWLCSGTVQPKHLPQTCR